MSTRVSLTPAHQVTLATTLLATALFLPWLGSVGLWDPW